MSDKTRILIVDDEPEVCVLLEDILTATGYEVIQAHRGDTAIALAQSRHPHLIILDVMMPGGLDGVQTYHRLKGKTSTRHIPVIFVTAAEPAGSVREQQLPLGEQCTVIGKPFQIEALNTQIKRLLAVAQAPRPPRKPS
jgi:DNA-binding response OmpR family regulator